MYIFLKSSDLILPINEQLSAMTDSYLSALMASRFANLYSDKTFLWKHLITQSGICTFWRNAVAKHSLYLSTSEPIKYELENKTEIPVKGVLLVIERCMTDPVG